MTTCACFALIALTNILTLDRAEFRLDDSVAIPVSNAWTLVPLKDAWTPERYAQGRQGWYRITVTLDEANVQELPDEPLGILLRRVNMNADIYLNGTRVASGGQFTEPVARNWNYPVYAVPPAAFWRAGDNVIHVRHVSYPNGGYLPEIYLGPDRLLADEVDTLLLLQVRIAEFLFPATLFIAILMFFTWLQRRKEDAYLWFSLAVAAWSIYIVNMFVQNLWISNHAWEWIAHYAVDLWVVLFCFFALRLTGYPMRWHRWFYLGYAAALAVAYTVIPLETLDWLVTYTHAFSMAIGAHLIAVLFRSWHQQRDPKILIMCIGLLVMLATGIHDWIFQSGWSGVTGTFRLHLHYYCAPLVFGFIAWHLTSRFAIALSESEELNAQLETRIAAAEGELVDRYQRVSQLEQEHAVLREQERLSKEIHDGVGGSLANAIMLTDLLQRNASETRFRQLRDVLSDGLGEVRHVISAMAGDISNTDQLFEYLTDRATRLADGLDLSFTADNQVNVVSTLTRSQGLNLARIAFEAINNAIKHANANSVTLRIWQEGQQVHVEVADNGEGFGPAESSNGHYGLKNMQRRAEEIDAVLDIASSPGGTTIQISLPCQ